MKKYLFFSGIIIIVISFMIPSFLYSEGEVSKTAQNAAQTMEKKIEQGGKSLEAAAKKADEKIGPKVRDAHERITKAATYAHERAMKRAAWLRKKAARLQAEAERIEACANAAIKREKEKLDEKARTLEKK